MNSEPSISLPKNQAITRIAIWSGPRNVSTAMMRSWGNRPDTFPHDEPFYAHYLAHTGLDHPGAAEVMAHHETDWRVVVQQLLGPIPSGKTIYYQKQMAHHLLPHHDRAWLQHLKHAFLIRNPKDMLFSLGKKLNQIRIEDTGLPQQVEIFEYMRKKTGVIPPVVDAADVRNHPEMVLGALCDALGVPFCQSMLQWPAGRRKTDGIWAKYWYASVEASTCFLPYRTASQSLPDELQDIHTKCQAYYDQLAKYRLTPNSQT